MIPVFLEFTIAPGHQRAGEHDYFIGASIDEVLDDTRGGTRFGVRIFSGKPRPMTWTETRALGFADFARGVSAVRRGSSKSFWLGSSFSLRQERPQLHVQPTA